MKSFIILMVFVLAISQISCDGGQRVSGNPTRTITESGPEIPFDEKTHSTAGCPPSKLGSCHLPPTTTTPKSY